MIELKEVKRVGLISFRKMQILSRRFLLICASISLQKKILRFSKVGRQETQLSFEDRYTFDDATCIFYENKHVNEHCI